VERISDTTLGNDRGSGLLYDRGLDRERAAAVRRAVLPRVVVEAGGIGGISAVANGLWMNQIARNLTDSVDGLLIGKRYLIHDRDPLFTDESLCTLKDAGVESVKLPPRSPNLNAYAERFVQSIKESCLEHLILFGESSLRTAVQNFVAHHHSERNNQGLGNRLILPEPAHLNSADVVQCRERLGGTWNY
jgi:hypothetical protein